MNQTLTRLTRRRQKPRQRSLLQIMRGESGAIDLASIMVGVLVLGIIGGVISATVFAVIPWAQDAAAQGDLAAVRTAEGVYQASHGGVSGSLTDLQAATAFAAGGGGAPGQPAASIQMAAGKPLLPASDPARQLKINANANGFVAAEISQTGRTFYATSLNTNISSSAPAVVPAGLSAPAYYALGASIAVGADSRSVAVNDKTNIMYASSQSENAIYAVDGASGAVKSKIAAASPTALAVNSTTNQIFAVDSVNGSVSVIDGTSGAVTASIAVSGSGLHSIVVNETTNRAYAAYQSYIVVMDTATDTVVTTIAGISADDLAVNPVTNRIYAAVAMSNAIAVVDGATNKIVSSIQPSPSIFPDHIAVDATTNSIVATDSMMGDVFVIDAGTGAVASKIAVNGPFQGITVNPATNTALVTAYKAVTVVDLAAASVAAAFPLAGLTHGLAVNATTGSAYATSTDPNTNGSTVSVITVH